MARNLKNIARLIEVANEKTSVEEAFLSDLKRSIELTAQKESRKPSQTYKPSSMNCIRCMYYQVTGEDAIEDKPNFTNVGICNSGSDIHERIGKEIPLRQLQFQIKTLQSDDKIIAEGYNANYGARPLKRYVQKTVETLAAKLILSGKVSEGDTITIDTDEKGFIAR